MTWPWWLRSPTRVVVMYRGKKRSKRAPVEQIFADPQHPYTKALLAAVPKLGEMRGKALPEPMKLMSAPEGTPETQARSPARTGCC